MKHQILISFKINATYSNVPIQFNEEFSPWFEWLVSELSSYKKIHFVFCIIKSARYNLIKIVYQIVGNKAKGRISKRVLQENIAGQIFRKTNISYPWYANVRVPYYWRNYVLLTILTDKGSQLWRGSVNFVDSIFFSALLQ